MQIFLKNINQRTKDSLRTNRYIGKTIGAYLQQQQNTRKEFFQPISRREG